MSEEIYRKKSLERIKSPESLNDYVKVSNPAVWLIVIAIAALIIGAIVWGIFGHIDTKVPAKAKVKNGEITCMISDDRITGSMLLKVSNEEYDFRVPNYYTVDEDTDCVAFVYKAKTSLKDGTYNATAIIERTAPITFVFN